MFESSQPSKNHSALAYNTPQARSATQRAPQPPTALPPLAGLLALALDEMDYGVVLLDDAFRVIYANYQARTDLAELHPLQLLGEELRVLRPADQRPLEEALLAAARRGIRRLVSLGEGEQQVSVSVVPLSLDGNWNAPALMLALGRRQVCANLTVQGFSRLHRLSPGEEQVLQALCMSVSPSEIARRHGVALSTVRTQITNIRTKTGTDSIRALVHQVSMLPPLIGALRHTPAHRPNNLPGTTHTCPW
jgi:DNA-binding CsgD family transcriptional regulator